MAGAGEQGWVVWEDGGAVARSRSSELAWEPPKRRSGEVHFIASYEWSPSPASDNLRGQWTLTQQPPGRWVLWNSGTGRGEASIPIAACQWPSAAPAEVATFLMRQYLLAAKDGVVSFGYDALLYEGIIDVHALANEVLGS